MKRANKKYIFIIIIVLVIVFLLFKYKNIEDLPVVAENKEFSSFKDLIVADSYDTREINIKDNPYTNIEIEYPYFKNVDDDFNSSILSFLDEIKEDHESLSKENWEARYDTQTKGEGIQKIPSEENKFYLHSSFEIIQSNPYYISFIINIDGYEGGAHGYVNNFSFNYDVKNQKNLSLDNIFSKDFNYLEYLSQESRKDLRSKYLNLSQDDKNGFENEDELNQYVNNLSEMIDSGTSEEEDNFKIFTFTKDKIKIYFSQYQVGPYVMGMPTFETVLK